MSNAPRSDRTEVALGAVGKDRFPGTLDRAIIDRVLDLLSPVSCCAWVPKSERYIAVADENSQVLAYFGAHYIEITPHAPVTECDLVGLDWEFSGRDARVWETRIIRLPQWRETSRGDYLPKTLSVSTEICTKCFMTKSVTGVCECLV